LTVKIGHLRAQTGQSQKEPGFGACLALSLNHVFQSFTDAGGSGGRLAEIVKELMQRDIESGSKPLECFERRYGAAVFDAGDIALE
jgi:hypothetical protein